MSPAIAITNVSKRYDNGFTALVDIDLSVEQGEIFALLGPNGAGKTTLINIVCGIVKASSGTVSVLGHDNVKAYRQARCHIGLVPQELTTDAFETVWKTVCFSRELFGKAPSASYIETLLQRLALWDKRDQQLRSLSGGMKRRVMIAKALSHEPDVLFLDEPTAGVDVELRKSMWAQVQDLRETGVTVILTTHYIEEAEEMADRIGIINRGRLVLTEDKQTLMQKMGDKQMIFALQEPIATIPEPLSGYDLTLSEEGTALTLTYGSLHDDDYLDHLLEKMRASKVRFKDISTRQNRLEEIFIQLVENS